MPVPGHCPKVGTRPCRGRPGRAHKPGRGLLSTCCLGQEVRPIAPGCPPAAGCVCSCAPGSMGEVPEVCVVPVRSAHPHRPTPPGEVPAAAGRSPDVYRASCHPHGGHFVLRRGDTPPWSGGLAHAGPRLVHPRGCRALEEGEVAVPPHRSWQKNPLFVRVFPSPVEGAQVPTPVGGVSSSYLDSFPRTYPGWGGPPSFGT